MLYSIIVSLLLGLLAVFPPYLGFLYTGKIIKEFKDRGIKKGLIVFFLSGIGISLIFNVIPLIAMFFSIYGVILVLYLIFEKYDIGEWNKAFMSTVISMLLLGIIYLLNRDFFLNLKVVFIEQVLVTIKKVEPSISGDEALKMTKDIFNELLVYSTVFVFLQNLLTSFTINLKKSINWEFSYVFLLGYIVTFVAIKIYKIDNIYVQNLMDSIKYLYILYGFKEFYLKIKNIFKMKFLSFGIVLLILSIQPAILFIYGSLRSFKLFTAKEEDI